MSKNDAGSPSKVTTSEVNFSRSLNLTENNSVQSNRERNEKMKSHSTSVKYYAVSTPEAVSKESALNFVFDDLSLAISCCKKLTSKNVRFKAFSSLEEAQEFVSSLPCLENVSKEVPLSSPVSFSDEKSSNFPSVSSQQLVQFRQEIEKGLESVVLDKVWSNPRYLVGSSDSLTILHAGTRYNAFHVAAKSNQTQIFYSLLNTVKDFQFLSLLYPDKNSSMLKSLKDHLLDLCLNMPCKPMHETPLHVAAKVGAVFIMKIMLSYDICEKKPNKHGKLPDKLMCERCPDLTLDGQPVKSLMKAVIEGDKKFYVPVVREKGNTVFPCVGELCTEDFVANFVADRGVKDSFLLVDSNLALGAFAGPLSKESAEKLSSALKKKKFSHGFEFTDDQKAELKAMCLSDFSKGLERVGRILACGVDCDYLEFFPAVDDYISSKTGVEVLECHLKCLRKLNYLKLTMVKNDVDPPGMCKIFVNFLEENLLDVICERLKKGFDVSLYLKTGRVSTTFYFIHMFQEIVPNIMCLTLTSFQADKVEHSKIHPEIACLLLQKALRLFDNATLHALVMHLSSVLPVIHDFRGRNYQQFLCILKFFCYHHLNEKQSADIATDKEGTETSPKLVCSCFDSFYRQSRNSNSLYANTFFTFPASLFLDSVSEQIKAYDETKAYSMHSLLQELDACLKADEKSGFNDPALNETDQSDSDDVFYLASESDSGACATDIIEMFISGSVEFSSRDVDIYRWIEKMPINESVHPHIFRYKNLVELKLGTLMEQRTDHINLTPASSSSAVERVMRIRALHRKTLFK